MFTSLCQALFILLIMKFWWKRSSVKECLALGKTANTDPNSNSHKFDRKNLRIWSDIILTPSSLSYCGENELSLILQRNTFSISLHPLFEAMSPPLSSEWSINFINKKKKYLNWLWVVLSFKEKCDGEVEQTGASKWPKT